MASFTIEEITILSDPFINAPVDKLNNLKHENVKDILIDVIGDNLPESEDEYIENYSIKAFRHFVLENNCALI